MEASTAASKSPESIDLSASFYVYIAMGLLGLLGNTFVCLVMLRYPKVFNSTTNKLILHQSVIDLVASLVFLLRRFLVVSTPVPDGVVGSLYCTLWWSEWPQYGMFVASTYNLVAISLERYGATCHPACHRNRLTGKRLSCTMVGVWICGWLPEAPILWTTYSSNDSCHATWPSHLVQAVTGILILLWELVIPISIMIFAYTKVSLELRKRSKARVRNNDARKMLSKANMNVTKTLVVVAICFAVCWIPTDVNYILLNLGLNGNSTDSVFYQATGAIVVINLCINPIIYCFTYDRFKKQLRKMVCGGCIGRSNQIDTLR
ncbi:nociceptin receptor-like [Acanthaster planci]|uniref:Nociceptin receptor-like n=1 Tax=Acanthaster planci TaxID=133434 RepID=A0A8B8A495_ACAPL|nr:nociceptin receptor-like [Acanthaster planci]